MIPDNSWSCGTPTQPFVEYTLPKPAPIASVFNIKVGPIELSQSDGVLNSRFWIVYQVGNEVLIRGAINSDTWSAPTTLFTESSVITAFSLSWDNLGRPAVFYQTDTTLKLWFYDSLLGSSTTKIITTNGKNPQADFDYVNDTSDVNSDTMIFYVKSDSLFMRLQRDRFDIEYPVGVNKPNLELLRVGMSVENRFQLEYRYSQRKDGSDVIKKVLESEHPLLRDMRENSFEVNFVMTQTPTHCDFLFLYAANDQTFSCIVQHSGYFFDAASEQERLFSLELLPNNLTDVDDKTGILVLRGGNPRDSYYHTQTIDLSVLSEGSYTLRFTQAPDDSITGIKQKRIEFIKDGAAIFDVTVEDENSLTLPTQSAIDALRFGAERRGDGYMNFYPATFGAISVKVNGVETTWNKRPSDRSIQSTPSGNPLTLKTFR